MQHISNNIVLNESLISGVMTYSSISFSLFLIFMLLLSRPRKVKPYLNRREVMPVSASMGYYQTKKENISIILLHGSFDQCDLIRRWCDEASFLLRLGQHPFDPINLVRKYFFRSSLLHLHRVTQTQGPQEQLLFLLIDWNKEAYKITHDSYKHNHICENLCC